MELTPRKKAIIAEIVRSHIETGEPIGSKILAERLPNAPSTATLRNEMSELTAMGYLEQPHTSAGRLPTSKAYRLYVSELMTTETLSDEGKEVLNRMISSVTPDPDNISLSAAKILAELTGLPVLSAVSSDKSLKIKKATIMPMGTTSAVVFVIASDGRARSRLQRLTSPITTDTTEKFDRVIAEKVIDKNAESLDMAYLQSVVALAGLDALELAPLLSTVFDLAAQLARTEVRVVGTANLLSICDGDKEAKRVLELLSGFETVNNIFSSATKPVDVIFGDDTDFAELKPTGMIVANLGKEQKLGRIAIVGPTRMSYGRLLPSIEYLAERVGKIMSDVLKGLEE